MDNAGTPTDSASRSAGANLDDALHLRAVQPDEAGKVILHRCSSLAP